MWEEGLAAEPPAAGDLSPHRHPLSCAWVVQRSGPRLLSSACAFSRGCENQDTFPWGLLCPKKLKQINPADGITAPTSPNLFTSTCWLAEILWPSPWKESSFPRHSHLSRGPTTLLSPQSPPMSSAHCPQTSPRPPFTAVALFVTPGTVTP